METYKGIIIRCLPSIRQIQLLDRAFVGVRDFAELATTKFQNELYHALKRKNTNLPMRTVALLAQRFARTLLKNQIIPLDKKNYKVVKNKDGWYSIQVKVLRNETRLEIPISRPDNDYYGDVLEGTAYGAVLFMEGNNVFLNVSIPVKIRYEKDRPTCYFGIDLNMYRHWASFWNPTTKKWECNVNFNLKSISVQLDKIQRELSKEQRNLQRLPRSKQKEMLESYYRARNEIIKKGHGDFIAQLTAIADDYWQKGYNVIFRMENPATLWRLREKIDTHMNAWLHLRWCVRKFAIMLETKGYLIEYVDPAWSSRCCHRCGAKGETYGKHLRLFKCYSCGLIDFNRDLNAARNISRKEIVMLPNAISETLKKGNLPCQ